MGALHLNATLCKTRSSCLRMQWLLKMRLFTHCLAEQPLSPLSPANKRSALWACLPSGAGGEGGAGGDSCSHVGETLLSYPMSDFF